MFGISGEHLVILAIVLVVFGPRRLPELGHTLGKAIRNFKDSIQGVEDATFRKINTQTDKLEAGTDPNLRKPHGDTSASDELHASAKPKKSPSPADDPQGSGEA